MIGVTQDVPGALGERLSMRSDVEAMVGQVEWETAVRGDCEGRGRVPALFFTLTAPVYKWERLNRLIRRSTGSGKTPPGRRLLRGATASSEMRRATRRLSSGTCR